ncbi:unnamed protein product [Oppiella nova]|uniref:glutathione transferase n=1 Tax=Oppiella nova TaxID=334625 RepID=A0A7R9QPZ4_9ACAR|nr:unnamed protein product [Oppiella nova]CAG2170712.1 unnamed protein product [Oppiella nova]
MCSKPTLAYWNVRGIAQHIRLLLAYSGVEFNDKRYEFEHREAWLSDKANLGMDFPNLPYYIDGKIKISQSLAILKYLARKHGLSARTDPELVLQEVAEQQVEDMRLRFLFGVVMSDPVANKEGYCAGVLDPQLDELVKFLGGKQWLTGRLSYVDFMAYEILDWFRLFSPETVAKYSAIGEYLTRFEALPTIKKYQASSQFIRWPLTGNLAKWGNK